jgi:hypothetical protein
MLEAVTATAIVDDDGEHRVYAGRIVTRISPVHPWAQKYPWLWKAMDGGN